MTGAVVDVMAVAEVAAGKVKFAVVVCMVLVGILVMGERIGGAGLVGLAKMVEAAGKAAEVEVQLYYDWVAAQAEMRTSWDSFPRWAYDQLQQLHLHFG